VQTGAGPQTTTELVVEGGRAGPLSFSYGPQGFVVNGGPVPIPADSGLASLNQALAPAGVTLGVARGADFAGGRSSDVLVVDQQVRQPSGPPAVLRLQFGGTATAVSGAPLLTSEPGEGALADSDRAVSSVPQGEPGATAGNARADGDGPSASSGGLNAPPTLQPEPEPEPGADVDTPGPTVEAMPATSDAVVGVRGVRFTGLRIAYWALVLVAGALVFASWWWRKGARQL
jgi:hypothetical protein